MIKKSLLNKAMIGIVLLGFIFLLTPFYKSLSPNSKARAEAVIRIDLSNLTVGEPLFLNYPFGNVIILKPSEEQKNSINQLTDHVYRESNNFVPELGIYIYRGHDTRLGCELQEKPKSDSQPIHYHKGAKWVGGYTSFCDSSYDYAGRTIKTYEYSYNGFTLDVPNLYKPKILRVGSDYIEILPGS